MLGTFLLESLDRIIAKVWADEAYRTAFLANPKAALRAQGVEVPDEITLNVHENSDTILNIVLPTRPELTLVGDDLKSMIHSPRCQCGQGSI